MEPAVSIIIPVYNGEKYLKQVLDSVLVQTLANIEIIIINDGSTDSTKQIINQLTPTHDHIKVIHQANQGEGASRNIGIKEAQGKYIGFVDADDTVTPNMFENLYSKALTTQADVVKSSAYYEVKQNKIRRKDMFFSHKYDKSISQLKRELIMSAPSIVTGIYRRAFLLEKDIKCPVGPPVAVDVAFAIKAYLAAKVITIDNTPAYYYNLANIHSASNNHNQDLTCILKILTDIDDSIKQHDYSHPFELRGEIFWKVRINGLATIMRRVENKKRSNYIDLFDKYFINLTANKSNLSPLENKIYQLIETSNPKLFFLQKRKNNLEEKILLIKNQLLSKPLSVKRKMKLQFDCMFFHIKRLHLVCRLFLGLGRNHLTSN